MSQQQTLLRVETNVPEEFLLYDTLKVNNISYIYFNTYFTTAEYNLVTSYTGGTFQYGYFTGVCCPNAYVFVTGAAPDSQNYRLYEVYYGGYYYSIIPIWNGTKIYYLAGKKLTAGSITNGVNFTDYSQTPFGLYSTTYAVTNEVSNITYYIPAPVI